MIQMSFSRDFHSYVGGIFLTHYLQYFQVYVHFAN